MRRRSHTADELDFFLHFSNARLHVEPDLDEVHSALPQLGTPRTENRRRHREQHLELLTSRTDPLDALYLHRLGIRTTPADKPPMRAAPELLPLIGELTARGEPGRPALTATLLCFDEAAQHRCAAHGSGGYPSNTSACPETNMKRRDATSTSHATSPMSATRPVRSAPSGAVTAAPHSRNP